MTVQEPSSAADLASQYRASTQAFIDAVAQLHSGTLDAGPRDGWSPRQIIHHIADSETHSYIRLRRLVADAPPVQIQGYDEEAWAAHPTLGYTTGDIDSAMAVFCAVRAASAELIARLQSDDLQRHGVHSESGAYDIHAWLTNYIAHPIDHAQQLTAACKGQLPE